MTRRLTLLAVLAVAAAGHAQGTLDQYERAKGMSAKARSMTFGLNVQAQWISDTEFWYRIDRGRSVEWIRVDGESRTKSPLFDPAVLAAELEKAVKQEVDPSRLPLEQVIVRDNSVHFRAFSKRWSFDLATNQLDEAERPTRRAGRSPRRSPDGEWQIRYHDGGLTVVPADGEGEPLVLAPKGDNGEVWTQAQWSPDSQMVAAFLQTPGKRLKMNYVETVPPDGVRPVHRSHTYDLPGDELDSRKLHLFRVPSGEMIEARTGEIDFWQTPPIWWSEDGETLRFSRLHRGYQQERVIEIARSNGAERTLIDERSDSRLHPYESWLHNLGQETILWTSQRSGWRHIYQYDANEGLEAQLTAGKWVIRGDPHVDPERGKIWFQASGREPNRDPYLIHQYVMNLDGSDLSLLTPEAADHSAQWSPNREMFVDSFSTINEPPIHVLRDGLTGDILMEIERADARLWLNTGWRPAEPFVAKGRDNQTDIHGIIWRPTDFDPDKKYPVVEYIYAGPHDSHVPKRFMISSRTQMLAELGFIVVQIDGMGTANRGKAFHDVSHQNLGDGGFPDRIKWIQAAAEVYPEMDLSRGVGIFGYSAGGYDSTRALLAHGDFYTVAASLAGNHDHRTDKTWWNELWMGWPLGPHYEEQSNPANAHKLKGKLLLVHGENDTNVNLHGGTMRLVDALVKADKIFDMLILPGRGHNLGGWYVDRAIFDHFVKHLYGREPRTGLN
jgi:dipeptidyl aminopeptidase/acylaminoacyl peptidase